MDLLLCGKRGLNYSGSSGGNNKLYFVCFAAGFVSAIIFLFTVYCVSEKRRRKKKADRKKGKSRKVKIDTYCKLITGVVIVHGLTMITMSYVLSWFSRETVSDVSTVLITEIVAPLCLYLVTNCIMNIFEKNELSFSKPIQIQKIRDVMDATENETEDGSENGAAG